MALITSDSGQATSTAVNKRPAARRRMSVVERSQASAKVAAILGGVEEKVFPVLHPTGKKRISSRVEYPFSIASR